MINEQGELMVEHHVKYLEIHGVDETEWMTNYIAACVKKENVMYHLMN